jgi:hypothetical protein
MIVPPGVVEIKGSPAKLLRLAAIGVAMTATSAALAFRWIPGIEPGSLQEFVGYVSLVFFGLCMVICLRRLMTAGRTVITITPDGIRDIRVAAELIPWSRIRAISLAEIRKQRFLVLAVDPEFERQLTLTTIARWSRGPNRALGFDGLCIGAQGLRIDDKTLFGLCTDHAEAARDRSMADRGSSARLA